MIQLKEFSSGDNTELYADDKEQQDLAAKAAERERLSKVGGLLKPADINADDDELWLEEELRTEYAASFGASSKAPYEGTPKDDLDGWDMYGL